MGLWVDTTPLRVSKDFRHMWFGQAVSVLGTMITAASLPYQVYQQTKSSVAVGMIGLVQIGPMLVFSLIGGALTDSLEKRKMLLLVTLGSLTCSAVLAANAALDHPQVWLLYVIAAVSSGIFAIGFPVLRSLLPLVLEPEMRPAAYTLQQLYGSLGMMAGPAVAGVLIAGLGLTTAYSIDVVTYAVAIAAFIGLSPSPPMASAGKASRTSIVQGLRFLRGHTVVISIFGIDFLAMVFGMPRALFPALSERLGGGATLYGLLLASVAAGAFVASVTSGWTSRVVRQGRAVLWSVAAWGVAIAVAGLIRSPGFVLAMFAIAGAADMISGVYRSVVVADATPDELRGRVSGVEFAVYAGGPVLGDVEAGVVGGLAGVPFAIVSGGIACVVGAVALAKFVPEFTGYRTSNAGDPAG